MPNRLAKATSPYLRQHADNPVDWFTWGPEALEAARAVDKPILLSIGYAACHWCHVMAHESFENEETARVMNTLFVNIKVDREERPDLDAIYMQAVHAISGHGGWPMTVFLTPDGVPFYGGTYYPPTDRHGIPSFKRVLASVASAWSERRESVLESAQQLRELLERAARPAAGAADVDDRTLDLAYRALARSFDPRRGGFGEAPKFPPSMALEFLLTHAARSGELHALEIVKQTVQAMAMGGMYDQVGGGIHRYSVDAEWLVPHFEKMLYDNALFARLGVHLWQATGAHDAELRRVVEQTLDWAVREMRHKDGGFYSSLDADSEGYEGRFYVWQPAELNEVLGADAELVRRHWGVTAEGNFEGDNILFVPHGAANTASQFGTSVEHVEVVLANARQRLYDVRATRVWPARDDKIVASWNALMVRAFVAAAQAFDRDDYRGVAIAAGFFLAGPMMPGGRLSRSVLDGVSSGGGMLEDHAAAGLAFFDLYALTFDRAWFERGMRMAVAVADLFYDSKDGAFFDTARDHESLIVRPRDVTDNATPSGNSLAAELLMRSATYAGAEGDRLLAESIVLRGAEPMAAYPNAFGQLLSVADMMVHGAVEVVLAGVPGSPELSAFGAEVHRAFVPSLVVAGGLSAGSEDEIGLLRGRVASGGAAIAYVCRDWACGLPARTTAELRSQLAALTRIGTRSPASSPKE